MSNKAATLPLQTKVSMTLLVVVAAFAVMTYLILQSVVAPAFNDLEVSAATTDLVRAERALQNDIENLQAVTADWSPWDDIYFYVRGENPGFEKSNLGTPTLENLGLDFIGVFALEGELVWGQVILDGNPLELSRLGVLSKSDSRSASLIQHAEETNQAVGIVRTDLGPAIIASMPILRTDDSGPIAGAMVMGQFLNMARLERLREQTEVDVSWLFADDPEAAVAVTDRLGMSMGQVRMDVSDREITTYRSFPDINGNPLLILSATSPRSISALGAKAVNTGLLLLCVVGVLIIAVIWIVLRRSILSPLETLATHMDHIRESGDLTQNSSSESNDEIGALARQFDSLTSEVHEARRALLDQSFKAGKADTAAEVLHNIRNSMTPMINGLDRLVRAMNVTDEIRFSEALEQLKDPDCPPDRALKLVQYLDASFRHIEATSEDALEDMRLVTSQARQIEAILDDQERFANVAPVAENLDVGDVVAEAANVIPRESLPVVEVEVGEEVSEYSVRAHRVGLLQVLGNLILNAFESIQRGGKQYGEIQLSASDAMLDDTPMVRLTVRDNGRGFSEELARQIFQRGYTSKESGESTGLGLHWCANAVAGMGGKIVAESNGEGQGAKFHVLLPAVQGG